MGKQQKAFKPGDYVFAKVKGYPAWPAKIVSLNGKKYNIYFYGTGESGNLPANDIFDYFAHKQQFCAKVLKRRDYNDGLLQIEAEITEAGVTSNGDKLNVTTDSSVDPDETINKTNVTFESEADQTINTTASEVDPPTPEPVKIPKKRAAEANTSISQPPAKTRKVEEVVPEPEPETEAPIVEKDETPPPEPENIPEEKEPEEEIAEENETEASPSVAEPAKEDAPVASPVASRGRKPAAKTPQPAQKSPRRAVKQEVMSPVYEPHVPAPESVSRSGRKIKPKRYLDEEANENANLQTPGKKIKIQPTTPVSAGPDDSDEQTIAPPMEVAEPPPADIPPPVPTIAPADNTPRKGRKKISKNKSLNLVSVKELENIEASCIENGDAAHKDDVLAAVLPSGKIVGIKLYRDFPESFASPTAQGQWITNMIKNSIQLKTDLESGRLNPATIVNLLETELPLSGDEIAAMKRDRDIEIRQRKVRLLKLECKLIGLEKEIKAALNLRRADVDHCIQLLNEFSELEISRLMILKQSGIINLFKKICHYIGNESLWKLSEEESAKFTDKADIVRKKAHECLIKIMDLFDIKNQKVFYSSFSQLIVLFKMHTSNLTPQEYLELVDEPQEMMSAYKTVSVSDDAEKKNSDAQLSNNKHESKADIKSIPKKADTPRQAVATN